jgi:hypothetical protein
VTLSAPHEGEEGSRQHALPAGGVAPLLDQWAGSLTGRWVSALTCSATTAPRSRSTMGCSAGPGTDTPWMGMQLPSQLTSSTNTYGLGHRFVV